jgi:glycine/D-amino acid oxidase-like deaminating enzyme
MISSRTGTRPIDARSVDPGIARSLAGAVPLSFWLDQPDAPDPLPALAGGITADLAVIGGGFTGLWTALLARERYPELDVVLVEAKTVGWAASGRNGGFCSASLTHGIGNGLERFGDEMPLLEKLGEQNLREIGETIARYGIDCDFRPVGEIGFATADWQLEGLDEAAVASRRLGHDVAVLDAAGARAELNSPRWRGALKHTAGNALLEPGRLAWGLRRACLDAGVRIYEHTPVTALSRDTASSAMTLQTPYGSVRAGRVALAAGVPGGSLLRRISAYVIPVWDYVLMTEPLSPAQVDSLGWRDGRGASDLGNQFHYFRPTRDNRVLWGGYDAVYYNGGRIRAEHETRPETFAALARHFFDTFPQLEGVSFTHRVGRRHRHVQPVLRVLRHRARRPGRVHGGLHGPGRRRHPLRRPGAARQALPARRSGTGAAVPGQLQAAAFPAGDAALGGDPGNARVHRTGGQERRPARRLAAPARPPWPRLRLISPVHSRVRARIAVGRRAWTGLFTAGADSLRRRV